MFPFCYAFFFFFFFFKLILLAKLAIFDQSEIKISKQFFFLNFNCCFLFLVQYCLKTCVNCVANCVTQKFTPMKSDFHKLFFSMSFYGQLRQLFHTSEPTLSKEFFFLNSIFLFSFPGSMVSKNICKLSHKLKNAKYLPELTWSWQNKPWFIRCNK